MLYTTKNKIESIIILITTLAILITGFSFLFHYMIESYITGVVAGIAIWTMVLLPVADSYPNTPDDGTIIRKYIRWLFTPSEELERPRIRAKPSKETISQPATTTTSKPREVKHRPNLILD